MMQALTQCRPSSIWGLITMHMTMCQPWTSRHCPWYLSSIRGVWPQMMREGPWSSKARHSHGTRGIGWSMLLYNNSIGIDPSTQACILAWWLYPQSAWNGISLAPIKKWWTLRHHIFHIAETSSMNAFMTTMNHYGHWSIMAKDQFQDAYTCSSTPTNLAKASRKPKPNCLWTGGWNGVHPLVVNKRSNSSWTTTSRRGKGGKT